MDSSMAVPTTNDANSTAEKPMPRRRVVAYWAFTLYVAITSVSAGVTLILLLPPVRAQLLELGYPPHFGVLLGVWKVLGAIALLMPRYPLLKEWAYAGLFFDFTSAVVAWAAAGGGILSYVGPLLALGALAASGWLRPSSRRLAGTYAPA